jgi:hypothetical protein
MVVAMALKLTMVVLAMIVAQFGSEPTNGI